MFVAVVQFPAVRPEDEEAFRDWFAWSNELLGSVEGLRDRRLLRDTFGGYAAIVEHDSAETFAAMHAAPVADLVHRSLRGLLATGPSATMFEVVDALAASPGGGCCGGRSGEPATQDVALGARDPGDRADQPDQEDLADCCRSGARATA